MNIMVVDDEKVLIESLRRGLMSKGYEVIGTSSAQEAIKYLEAEPGNIDMIITDYAMPGMSGLELLARIRERYGSLPVIMMTAYAEIEVAIGAIRNRCDSFIEKPFTLPQLISEVERAKVNLIQNTKTSQLYKIIPKLVHQISNPLAAIMGYAEVVLNDPRANDFVKRCLNGILDASQQIRDLNKEILTLGQGTDNRTEAVNISETIESCINFFGNLILIKGVSLEWDASGLKVCVLGNRFGLEQVFKNLILNAIDAMDGCIDKRLRVYGEAQDGDSKITVVIEDTGCGIPEESLKDIFTPYVTRKEKGTGLGLAVVKSILETIRGDIQVKSREGQGTAFRVTLPVIHDCQSVTITNV